jgi:hypothetical protein
MCGTTMREMELPDRPVGMLSTLDLLERFKKGDEDAVSQLVERSIPPLQRWARGRLPQWARSLAERHICGRPSTITFETRFGR